jgi:hypothetical protein
LMMADRVVQSVAEQIPSAFVQGTRHALLSGGLAAMAPDYAAVGVERIFIRVRGLKAERADRDEFLAYLDLGSAFRSRGMDVVADCTGRLGPALVAGPVFAFSLGTQFFRSVPEQLLSKGGGGGGVALGSEAAAGWSEQPRESGVPLDQVRADTVVEFRRRAILAAREPRALIEEMRASGDRYARVWASVLAERLDRAA